MSNNANLSVELIPNAPMIRHFYWLIALTRTHTATFIKLSSNMLDIVDNQEMAFDLPSLHLFKYSTLCGSNYNLSNCADFC